LRKEYIWIRAREEKKRKEKKRKEKKRKEKKKVKYRVN
jgi:hypothetical protein